MKGHHPGATWRKCDLQCHTPRDHSWKSAVELPGGTDSYEAARHAWADSFIAACHAAQVSVVAITDHHDVCISRYVQQAAARDGNRVLVYPGLEVTCSDNAQCLAIIDPNASDQLLLRFISLKGIVACDAVAGRTQQTTPAQLTVEELFSTIHEDPVLREASIIMPHFSDGAAHKHLNVSSHHMRFANLSCDGVYVEKPFSEIHPDTLSKIRGEVTRWGKRRRAVLTTGDNRFDDWGRLGRHECWIKLGEESIEALRQALLADEARICFERPIVPSERIVSLTVKSSLTGDDPLSFTFNEGFTAIIGGRGSGKSSLLEYLRFGLARTVQDFPNREVPSSGGKEDTLIPDTLVGGFVEVALYRDGVRETWRREWATKDVIAVTDASDARTNINISEAQRRFRARAFYQKGLSTTVNNKLAAADQITGIAAAEVLERRRNLEQDIDHAKIAIKVALGQTTAHWQSRLEQQQAVARVEDLRQRIKAVSERLEKEGVSEEAKRVLNRAPIFTRTNVYLEEIQTEIENAKAQVNRLRDHSLIVQTDVSAAAAEFKEIEEVYHESLRVRKAISDLMDAAIAQISALELSKVETARKFALRAEAFSKEHQDALQAQLSHKSLIDESTSLARELEAAEAKLVSAISATRSSEPAIAALTEARQRLHFLLAARFELLKASAQQVAGKSARLQAQVRNDDNPEEYIAALCKVLSSTYVSDPEQKCQNWLKTRIEFDIATAWSFICDSMLEIYEAKISSGNLQEPSAEQAKRVLSLFFGGQVLSPNQTKRVYANINDITIGEILSAVPRDFIQMKYVDDQGRKKHFDKASPGQQASALLELLLQQSAGTLIIDQPEDDLDNRVVMKIVELIKISKSQRQLIFTTHNPNMVVNGDADKIIALEANDEPLNPNAPAPEITLDLDGAIETEAVRLVITKIMEGGEDAFELRRRKYRIEYLR